MRAIVLFLFGLFSLGAAAAQLEGGHFNEDSQTVQLEVVYSGGCRAHEFQLVVHNRQEYSDAVYFYGFLDHVEGANDPCEKVIHEQLTYHVSWFQHATKPAYLVVTDDEGNETTVYIPAAQK